MRKTFLVLLASSLLFSCGDPVSQARSSTVEDRLTALELQLSDRLQIENYEPDPALVIHQAGNSTAAVIQADTSNPALRLVAMEKAAALEVHQENEKDAIQTNGDIRCRQSISLHRACIGVDGALQIADQDDPTEYHDVLRLGPAQPGEIILGNPGRGNAIRLRVDAASAIDFEVGDQLIMRIQVDGIRVRPGTIREDL